MASITSMQKEAIKWIESYIGELPKHIRETKDTTHAVKYIKHTMYMLLSDETISEHQYAECETWLTEFENSAN